MHGFALQPDAALVLSNALFFFHAGDSQLDTSEPAQFYGADPC